MLDRLQAKLSRHNARSQSRSPQSSSSSTSSSTSSSQSPERQSEGQPTRAESSPTSPTTSNLDLPYEDLVPYHSLSRTWSITSTSTNTTLPAYSTVGTNTSPPKYTAFQPQTQRRPNTATSNTDSAWTNDMIYDGENSWSGRRKRGVIPFDHPVYEMSGQEQTRLRRRGLDPVVVAEMKALSRGRRRS